MSAFSLHAIEYSPGGVAVRITVRPADGPFRGTLLDLYTTQQALAARCPKDRATWSDAECYAEASAQLAKDGATLAPSAEEVA